ncbi:hypothetical protein Drorol1_Dr00005508 [Drosera rotundifolia]
MKANTNKFVAWEERFVSQEKGHRLVHYFLKDSFGNSILCVIGTERSLRHLIYTVSHKFVEDFGAICGIGAGAKWKTRRELIDWLMLIVGKQQTKLDSQSIHKMQSNDHSRSGSMANATTKAQEMISRKVVSRNSDIAWSGAAWTCSKGLIHYPSYNRDGIAISVHSFVSIKAAKESQFLGYLEDLYEDKKGMKKARVRWFRWAEELRRIYPKLSAHSKEVFITPQAQVISADCVDGPASVLIPEHYARCRDVIPQIFWSKLHLCFRQYKNDEIKPFALSVLHGYHKQAVLSCLDHPLNFSQKTNDRILNIKKEQDIANIDYSRKGTKRNRTCFDERPEVSASALESRISDPQHPRPELKLRIPLKKCRDSKPQFCNSFNVGDEIELLCQDSGLRGCWFRCRLLRASPKLLKVRYNDVQDADECGNLEEWVPASRVATPDSLGIRSAGRLIVRPLPPGDFADCKIAVGEAVDVWWSDGWWEGLLTSVDDFAGLQVYLPGESRHVTVERQNIRASKDWVNGGWVSIKPKPDILNPISPCSNLKLQQYSSPSVPTMAGDSLMPNHAVAHIPKLEPVDEDTQQILPSATSNRVLATEGKINLVKQLSVSDQSSVDHALSNVEDIQFSCCESTVAGI